MKKLISLLLFCVPLFGAGQSNNTNQELIHNFETDILSDVQIDAFELKASQKITDLYNLLNACSLMNHTEDSISTDLNEMEQYIISLFDNPACHFEENVPSWTSAKKDISHFLLFITDKEIEAIEFQTEAIQCSRPLIKKGDYYTGTLSYRVIFKQHGQNRGPFQKEAQIFLKKKSKNFGSEVREVWQLYLGDIISAE